MCSSLATSLFPKQQKSIFILILIMLLYAYILRKVKKIKYIEYYVIKL